MNIHVEKRMLIKAGIVFFALFLLIAGIVYYRVKMMPSVSVSGERESLVLTEEQNIVYIISYNASMIPRLTILQEKVARKEYRDILQTEIDREKEELALFRKLYRERYGKDYDNSETLRFPQTLSLPNMPWLESTEPMDDSTLVGIFRGLLEHNARDYYSFAKDSSNETVRANAEAFLTYKKNIVSSLENLRQ